MKEILSIFFISSLPIAEIRAGIPFALHLGFDPITSFLISYLGNIFPVAFLLLVFSKIQKLIKKFKPLNDLYLKIEKKVLNKKNLIEKYGYFGLVFFVSIPLPITGAWTACLLAFLLGLDIKKSFISIAAGICIAGIIVTLASVGVFNLLGL